MNTNKILSKHGLNILFIKHINVVDALDNPKGMTMNS